jgi:hypothetical protein
VHDVPRPSFNLRLGQRKTFLFPLLLSVLLGNTAAKGQSDAAYRGAYSPSAFRLAIPESLPIVGSAEETCPVSAEFVQHAAERALKINGIEPDQWPESRDWLGIHVSVRCASHWEFLVDAALVDSTNGDPQRYGEVYAGGVDFTRPEWARFREMHTRNGSFPKVIETRIDKAISMLVSLNSRLDAYRCDPDGGCGGRCAEENCDLAMEDLARRMDAVSLEARLRFSE